ncbi:MAG TPA: methyltransferase domain-containing protein [Solirubrobacteraceae bacterium]|jgi:O-antigen/teichoic acid export membrane protein/SAM-dependent methyltransferase|nr:methyltransferase domain-containing protein [Solirubrobacteraceae bacterium]
MSEHHRGHRFLALTGGRVTRDTLIYIVGLLAVGPFSLVSVAVLTRVLAPGQYGDLALLLVLAGYLTTLYNTGSLHGTFMWVYGAAEGEGDDVGAEAAITSTPKRALGTGVVLTLMIVTAGTALCFVAAPAIAGLLLGRHTGDATALVRWAAASAAAGSLWRLTVNVLRMERKPVRFASFNALRPLFVVGGSVPLVLAGYGVEGALAGTALGTLVASAACIAMARRSYALAFSWADARKIVALGATVVVPVVCLFIVHNIDVVLLSRFAPAHEVGIYRVASRFAAVPSYFASAFLMAWAPLERGVMFQATYRHVGTERVRGAILTYYLLAGLTLVLLLDVSAPALVLLAGPQYRAAAPLIPLAAAGFVCYGLYMVLARVVRAPRHMLFYAAGALLAGMLDIGLSTVTIPWLGAYGVPAAMIAGLLVSCLMWIMVVRGLMEASLAIEARPLAGLAGAVALAAAIQALGLHLWPNERPLVLAAVLITYFAAILACGVVPRPHRQLLARLLRNALRRGVGAQDPTAGLERLDPRQRSLLAAIERDGRPLAELAQRRGRSERELRCEYVAALRALIGAPPAPHGETSLNSEARSEADPIGAPPTPGEHDARIAAYLLSREPEAQRDVYGRTLIEEDVDGLHLMELDEAAQRLRALPPQAWAAVSAERPPQILASVHPSPAAAIPPAFAGIVHELRDHVIEHCERSGERLDTPAGIMTLDTNSILAPGRGRLLLRLLAHEGMGSISERRVLDLGAGFGAMALYFAHLGAEVVAVDPNEQRTRVAAAIARRRGLPLSVATAHAQSLPFADGSFDIVVANNSLCYIVGEQAHAQALREIHRVLRPGGWVVMRNPNRLHPRDQFTRLPLLNLLPPMLAQRTAHALGRHRSQVHLRSPGATVRTLRRAGFAHARWRPQPGHGARDRFAGYQHVLARRDARAPIADQS